MKKIINYENKYCINENGVVFRVWKGKNKARKTEISNNGYERITLSVNGKNKKFLIHRLVAEHYIPNPENKPQVNHINGVKTDNRVVNLEWCSSSYNIKEAFRMGRKPSFKSKLKEHEVIEIKKAIKEGFKIKVLAVKYNVSKRTITDIKNNKTWVNIKI